MKYTELVKQGQLKLFQAGINDADYDAWILMEKICCISKTDYFVKMQDEVPEEISNAYFETIEKRITHYPLQYIIGEWEFMGLKFKVNENVLIPRQDTERLVERALYILREKDEIEAEKEAERAKLAKKAMQAQEAKAEMQQAPEQSADMKVQQVSEEKEPVKILDLCTGSGCIGISLAKLYERSEITAVDISEPALEVARENVKLHNLKNVKLLHSDLFEKLGDDINQIYRKFDMIVSNPPYICTDEIEKLMPEVRDYEPRLALDGAADGLRFYKNIIYQSVNYLNPNGCILFEIGCEQGEAVKGLLEQYHFSDVEVIRDLAGLDRVVIGWWKPDAE